MAVNPFLQFLKSVEKPRDALFIFDVDLAIQPSMSTDTTEEQRNHMNELFHITDGGVLFFTGRTHQSVNKTFGHDYAGVFEHYSVARFGHGQGITFMAPKLDVENIGRMAAQSMARSQTIRIAETPADIRENTDLAVFIEMKNASVAFVHTLSHGTQEQKDQHKAETNAILEPMADAIIQKMGLSATHVRKTGGDAVEIVPKGLAKDSEARSHLLPAEIERINAHGLGKDTAVHNFQPLYPDRRMIITGDSAPDLDAMVVNHKHYNGQGVFVSNGHALQKEYRAAVQHEIPDHTLTWPLLIDTAIAFRASGPQFHTNFPGLNQGP